MLVSDLVRYDPTRNCFVLKACMNDRPTTWPDGTPKSMNNAFNWRAGVATAIPFVATKNNRSRDLTSNGNVYSYTKAKLSSNAPTGRAADKGGKLFTVKKQ